MRMYVWSDHHSYLVVAHASSVAEARTVALREIGTTDGSTPNRQAVIERIKEDGPSIWIGANADYAITELKDDLSDRETYYS